MGFSRHQSRELAVQFVFQWALDPMRAGTVKDIPTFWKEQSLSDDSNRPFFELLAKGVAANLPQIDHEIESVLENWRFDRIEKVDLAVLRVAVFEMLFQRDEKVDAPIVINEAVEVAKKFGGAESSGFVNGILDALLKRRTAGGGRPKA